ncbi:hypothetical protein [Cellulosimicrobium cellulans]|uniref:hypothetical protein n=1 Tax=Cellulosimicrobium cellulans TaxID=1710 RepID=UPI0018840EB1|nr:hypothetical protein [Cellulosimicrobium cellulans]MBE9938266.1 hypothetical protein [Cellulosimicrobium cellulans]
MAWWEDEKPSASRLADQLADSSRPAQPASPYADDRSGSWAVLPLWLLLGAALTAGGVALLVSMRSATGVCLGTTVLALGLFYLSQYGVLAGTCCRSVACAAVASRRRSRTSRRRR